MKILIQDERLTPDLKRTRSGRTQEFRAPDKKSFDADFTIEPPEKHIYAELIDNEWYWVNGCPECNGLEPTWRNTHIKCLEHDRCVSCRIKREELKEIPWGHQNGFKCKPCADKEKAIKLKSALEKIKSLEAKLAEITKDRIMCIIDQWKYFWMDQKQNSEQDYQNYLRRAMGVDANMVHHLASLIAKSLTEVPAKGENE